MSKVISIFDKVPLTLGVLQSTIEREEPVEITLSEREISSLVKSIMETDETQEKIVIVAKQMAEAAERISELLDLDVPEKIKDYETWWNDAYYEIYDDLMKSIYAGKYKIKHTTIKPNRFNYNKDEQGKLNAKKENNQSK